MAQTVYRANLSAKGFPFDAANFGRSVIVPGNDQNFNRQLVSREDQDKDIGIPQAFYMHNVLPTEYGYKSVGYVRVANAVVGGLTGFRTALTGYRDTANRTFVGRDAGAGLGFIWSYDVGNTVLVEGSIAQNGAGENFSQSLTVAHVNNRCFVCQGFTALALPYQLIEVTNLGNPLPTYTIVEFIGLPVNSIRGIFDSRGYLCWWTATTIGWSSTLNPLDHTPSEITGAGNTQIQEAKGDIIYCSPTLWGFIVYCRYNIIAAEYTGNIVSPWIFREIYNSAGVDSHYKVTKDENLDVHYAFTSTGVVRIANNRADPVVPELQSVVENRELLVFDQVSGQFITESLGTASFENCGIFFAGKRYLCISIGNSSGPQTNYFSMSFVYDVALQRWGMLRIPHNCIFSWWLDDSVAVLQGDGSIFIMRTSDSISTPDSVIVFGRYQLSRPLLTSLQAIEVQNRKTFTTTCSVHTSLRGGGTDIITPATLTNNSGSLRIFNCNRVGTNHCVVLRGEFDLNTLILRFAQHGRR